MPIKARRTFKLRHYRTLLAIIPRDGAQTLSEVSDSVLSVVCEPYGRRERYDVERLIERHVANAELTDLLVIGKVAHCPQLAASC